MNKGPFFPGAPLPPEFPAWQPVMAPSNSFWQSEDVHVQERKLREIIDVAKSMQEELEQILLIKRGIQLGTGGDPLAFDDLSATESPSSSNELNSTRISRSLEDGLTMRVAEIIKAKKISLDTQESLSIDAANSLALSLRNQLAPFSALTSQGGSWMERSMVVKLSEKLQKSKRNKHWRKRKRRHVAELLRKERENFEKADHEADEWRAREIAKDIAQRKVESMKKMAKLKADEERKRLESELELILIVEKLQELRSIRIQKLKKQGHFLPEEDDKFLERVRAAVEEEERQAAAVADTDADKDAIATAEESRKAIESSTAEANAANQNEVEASGNQGQEIQEKDDLNLAMKTEILSEKQMSEARGSSGAFDSSTNLPFEFVQYYHGSSNDMGTLIEVRRMWDAYIRPGGSRLPEHLVQPPPPADEVWTSYLVRPK